MTIDLTAQETNQLIFRQKLLKQRFHKILNEQNESMLLERELKAFVNELIVARNQDVTLKWDFNGTQLISQEPPPSEQ